MNYNDIKRINVVGTSGSGKSTVAKKLSGALSIPYVEMDQIFWGQDWHWPSDEKFFNDLRKNIAPDKWILDGNYTRTLSIKWEKVQMVVWIDLPLKKTLFQAITRAFKRSISGKEIWPNTGNKESFRKSFFSKDSIILWTLKTYKKVKQQYVLHMNNEKYSHIKFVRLTSHKEIDEFLEKMKLHNTSIS